MIVNPMQRRARNSFIFGFIVAIILGIVVAMLLVSQLNKSKVELKKERAKQKQLIVAKTDISEFSVVNLENIGDENTIVTINPEEVVTLADINEAETKGKKLLAKTKIPKGTVITKSMLIYEDEKDANDLRMYEISTLMLPTTLKEEDIIDVRIAMPNGQDFIVLSKKTVEKADADSIWLKLTEDEILTFNCAMVESYLIDGTKMYTSKYIHPGIQKKATMTYPLTTEAWQLIQTNENIVDEARQALIKKHNKTSSLREKYINREKRDAINNGNMNKVVDGVRKEVVNMKQKRQDYLDGVSNNVD